MQKQFSILKAKIGVVVLMAAGAAFAAPYEVSGPDVPKPKRVVSVRVPEVELPLEQGFLDPPKANRPQVWWWFDATAPDAAITRDLEGLKRVGISGFHIYGGSVTEKGWLPRAKWVIYDAGLPEVERLTHTNINPYKPGDPLLPSGLLGPVQVVNVDSE